jgi:hypothetical protein
MIITLSIHTLFLFGFALHLLGVLTLTFQYRSAENFAAIETMGGKAERAVVFVEESFSFGDGVGKILKGFFDSFTRLSTHNKGLYFYVVISISNIHYKKCKYLTFIVVHTSPLDHPNRLLIYHVYHSYFQSPEIGHAQIRAPQMKNPCDFNCYCCCYSLHFQWILSGGIH